ncbi:MAG: transporter substrate-binding domain-containing protein [Aliishimia sp.]
MKFIYLAFMLALFGGPAVSDELLTKGTTTYKQLCSRCHGFDMVNPGTGSYDLRKFPRDDKPRFVESVSNGKDGMPAMGDLLIGDELDALWRYVSTRGGKEPAVEESSLQGEQHQTAGPKGSAELNLMTPDTLTACLPINGGVMSGRRASGGAGLDYDIAQEIAKTLELDLKVIWYEGDIDEDTNPIRATYAMLSRPLCDVVPGYALYAPTLGKPKGDRAAVPRWKKPRFRDKFEEPEFVDLRPITTTIPYVRMEMGVVLRAPRDVLGFADLEGLTLGIQEGTLAGAISVGRMPSSLRANAVSRNPGPAFLWDMEKGDFDAALVAVAEYDFHKRQNKITKLILSDYRHPLGFNIGFAMLEDNKPLWDHLNGAVEDLLSNGRVDAIALQNKVHIAVPRRPFVQPELRTTDFLSR